MPAVKLSTNNFRVGSLRDRRMGILAVSTCQFFRIDGPRCLTDGIIFSSFTRSHNPTLDSKPHCLTSA